MKYNQCKALRDAEIMLSITKHDSVEGRKWVLQKSDPELFGEASSTIQDMQKEMQAVNDKLAQILENKKISKVDIEND